MQKSKTILLILILIFGVLNFIGNSKGKTTGVSREKPVIIAMTNNGYNYFIQKGDPMGYQKELLDFYSKYSGLTFQIQLIEDTIDIDSFNVDLIVSSDLNDSITYLLDSINYSYSSLPVDKEQDVWLTRLENRDILFNFDAWFSLFRKSDEYAALVKKYSKLKYARSGTSISVFDNLFKKHATNTFDWLFLSALVYHESYFTPDITSPQGAAGLMQLMPETAEKFGVNDVYNPEDNIKTGVRLLSYLYKQILKSDIPHEERLNFLLISYNAGYGRMLQCRKFTQALGMNPNSWADVKYAISLMNDPELKEMQELAIPKFNGGETISFVNSVSSRYNHYRQLFGGKS